MTFVKDYLITQLDGRSIGYVYKDSVHLLAAQLRLLKIRGKEVPNTLEIALVTEQKGVASFPACSYSPGRLA